ncbi:glycosyltransferase family 2 protein [Synechococcus sp. PCC 6312]|uniref:glycosyltransferase family 2 protein n=1 Tax=Synechococcus sp. (strain ATCC 27167 / PCC 6312) TaxID=195253 RepID=UPI00029EF755|nr:glycosyltransferase [Synechococcus sp. PCC 6312]AFY61221.1 glycosyl transferase [Synechococcus sp. PCC 6312]
MAIGCGLAVLWWKWWSDASFLAPLHSRTIQAQVPLVWLDTTGLPEIYLWLIPLSCWGLAWGLTRLCPKPQLWSRAVMVAILLALLVRYVLWRVLTTLNFDSPSAAVVSVGFLGLELLVLAGQAWQLNWLLYERPKVDPVSDPHLQSQQSLAPIQTAVYAPKVDILIPTYDEPLNILKRTIVGCQALDYENVEIFLLDDTRRPEVRELAAILGCHYLTRPNNLHAKAGNLNHGLEFCQGELVVVFDADFVPTRNFLTRTVGFFADATVGLLQTYQSFYNHDPVARNLGLTDTLPQEVEIFSRHYQVLRDAVESAICYGSAFVVRRAALEAVGGFDVDTLSEDYLTGVRLNSLGYRVLYLEESLSAGLCADDLAGHIQQRLRWARGSLQSFFVGANPLTISGLNRQQRIAHLEGLVQWFHSPIRLIFLLLPLVANGLGLVPIKATIAAWIFYSLPYYLVTLSSFSWLNGRSRSALMSDVYSVLQCVPITITVFQTLLFPFGRSFQVTPKGRQRWNYRLNGRVAWPLLLLLGASLINLLFCAWALLQPAGTVGPWEQIGLAWGIYNLLVLGLAVMACVDGPQVDGFLWFALKRPLTVDIKTSKDWEMSGQVRLLSEGGAVIDLETPIILPPGTTLELEFGKSHFKLLAQAISHGSEQAGPGHELRVMFEELSLPEYRKLVQLLFCQPGQWCWPKSQGELKTLGQLLKTLVRPAWQRYPQGRLTPVVIDLPPGHDLPRSQLPKETFA